MSIKEKFYKKISDRVSEAVKQSGKTYYQIYPDDYKLISPIINNKQTKNNPYLLTPSIIGDVNIGLLSLPSFHDIKEIIWGTDEEIEGYLSELFSDLMDLLLDEGERIANEILYDYVPYAKYATYFEILFPVETTAVRLFPALYYGVYEDDVIDNLKPAQKQAIRLLYPKCYYEFRKMFFNYTREADSCREIVKTFRREFISKQFIPMLEKHRPDEHSLGLRVRNLILADLSTVPELIEPNSKLINREAQKKLINASSTYIVRLEEVQRLLIESNANP